MLIWKRIFRTDYGSRFKKLHTSNVLNDAVIINGKKIADEIQQELRTTVTNWVNAGNQKPKLVAILVGNNPASKTYVDRKMKASKFIGINSYTIHLEETVKQDALLHQICDLNKDTTVSGIIVQMPLPQGIDEKKICQAIAPKKDVDGFHLENIGNLTLENYGIVPATALAVKELIVRSKIETVGKNAVVIGRSKHVGLPIALLLHGDSKGVNCSLDMTTTICHIKTPPSELKKFTQLADVVVVATGVPKILTKDMVKPGACVIDVGINRIKIKEGKYRLVGDVDYENVKKVAGYITPVPGGVGPMTVTMLLKNTVTTAMNNQNS